MAFAENVVHLDQHVPDEDFYRALACAAKPGGACQQPLVRWPKARQRDVRVALARIEDGYPKREARIVDDAINRAIEKINNAGSNIVLRRVAPAAKADINIFLLNVPQNSVLRGSRIRGMDGTKIEAASSRIWWRGPSKSIYRGVIVIAPGHTAYTYKSIVLEELYQSLGLLADITGNFYKTATIAAQNSNMRLSLSRQDIAALHLHYPMR